MSVLHIQKNKAPEFLEKFKEKNPTADYDSDSFKPLVKPLRDYLVREQRGLCAYCCSRISSEASHNEHIEPRHGKNDAVSRRSLEYTNIVASCNTADTCGKKKDNEYDAGYFISPVQVDCEDRFSYDPDGYMKGDEYTISLLNLNSYKLRMARRAIYKEIFNLTEDDIRLIYCSNSEEYWPFSNVIFWFLKNNMLGRAEYNT